MTTVNSLHATMREFGAGETRRLASKVLFKIWGDEIKGKRSVKSEDEMVALMKDFPHKFDCRNDLIVSLILPNQDDTEKDGSTDEALISMAQAKDEIFDLLAGQPQPMTLQAIRSSLPIDYQVALKEDWRMKQLLNMNRESFVFINSHTVKLAEEEEDYSSDDDDDDDEGDDTVKHSFRTKDVKVRDAVKRTMEQFGTGDNSSINVATLHKVLAIADDKSLIQEFKKMSDLEAFISTHNLFALKGGDVSIRDESSDSDDVESVASGATSTHASSFTKTAPKQDRPLSSADVKTLEKLLQTGHYTHESSMPFRVYSQAPVKGNKMYFKMDWVLKKFQPKTKRQFYGGDKLSRLIRKHHSKKFVLVKRGNHQLIQLKSCLAQLPTEEHMVEVIHNLFKCAGKSRILAEELFGLLSKDGKFRIKGATSFSHFALMHKDDFMVDAKGRVQDKKMPQLKKKTKT